MEKVLDVKNLEISFRTENGLVRAVRNVSFDLHRGETLCIVGESGSGKSVTSKAIMGILAKNAIVDNGTIIYEGENLLDISEEAYHKIRGNKIGMIFQDPLSSLNPIVKIGKQITEATILNGNRLKKLFEETIAEEQALYNKVIFGNTARNAAIMKQCKNAVNNRTEKSQELLDKENLLSQAERNYSRAVTENDESKILEAKTEHLRLKSEVEELNKARKKLISAVEKEEFEKIKPLLLEEKKAYKIALKEAENKLNEKKKEAKVVVRDYKKKVKLEHKENVLTIKSSFVNPTKTEKIECKAKLIEEKERYTKLLKVTKKEAKEYALKIMEEVGINQPEKRFYQYPFEFSGGMRQRIVIAIALTANPDILICDEPTTALDVTIQAQILDLINKLKRERQLSCVFITHDLGVVANMADRVAVMYAGQIVEYGNVNEIFYEPKHPYTWALLSSVPDVDSQERLEAIPGTPPNMIYPPKGDAFALRSKYAMNIDFKEQPPYFKVSDTHYAATWLLHKDAPKVELPKIVSARIEKALEEVKNEAK